MMLTHEKSWDSRQILETWQVCTQFTHKTFDFDVESQGRKGFDLSTYVCVFASFSVFQDDILLFKVKKWMSL